MTCSNLNARNTGGCLQWKTITQLGSVWDERCSRAGRTALLREQTAQGCRVCAGKERRRAPVTRGGNTTGLGAEAERWLKGVADKEPTLPEKGIHSIWIIWMTLETDETYRGGGRRRCIWSPQRWGRGQEWTMKGRKGCSWSVFWARSSWEHWKKSKYSWVSLEEREGFCAHWQMQTLLGKPGYKGSLEEYVKNGNANYKAKGSCHRFVHWWQVCNRDPIPAECFKPTEER